MTYLATTRGSILRGSTEDHGDIIDDNSDDALLEGFTDMPVGLIEKRRTVLDPVSGERRTVRWYAARVPTRYQPEEGDRLRDNRTGIVYSISEHVRVPRSLAGQASLTLDCTRTGEA